MIVVALQVHREQMAFRRRKFRFAVVDAGEYHFLDVWSANWMSEVRKSVDFSFT
jgi:hypothetical protein